MKTNGCECTSECGDDPQVQARLVRGCDEYRARNTPERLRADLAAALAHQGELRACLAGLVAMMDRMESDSPDAEREQAEAEWDVRKAVAKGLLAEVE